ncbi:hypothetical protein MMC09_004937 [Bachmanniomyces sp. S44760]|nr:hypothetical protein [Bachmanniomyces sp. S44760]
MDSMWVSVYQLLLADDSVHSYPRIPLYLSSKKLLMGVPSDNRTISAQCKKQALFSNLDSSQALGLWLTLLFIVVPLSLYGSWFTSVRIKQARQDQEQEQELENGIAALCPRSVKVKKWFIASTIMLALNAILFLIEGLSIQAQEFCTGGPIDQGGYSLEWITTVALVGGTLATALTCWINALRIMQDKEASEVIGEFWFFQGLLYVILTPAIILAGLLLLVIKGPSAFDNTKLFKWFREWRASHGFRRSGESMGSWKSASRPRVAVDRDIVSVPGDDDNDLESHLIPSSPSHPPPPYVTADTSKQAIH